MEDTKRRLAWHGMALFLLGLVTGLVEANFQNPRMGLAAHLEGVMNGTFLVALAAIWPNVKLSARQETMVLWSVLYGTYVNWAVTTLAAMFGTAALSPITGAGHSARPWQEMLVTWVSSPWALRSLRRPLWCSGGCGEPPSRRDDC
jgi:(hydroxyamino)benzene mutase